ncbi:MAG TPA: hypothetical protein H9836_16510 [Candidatus Nocardiopsis merdipullorum]|nr:hypothetical protein [Candidatus Nocardiopsis merdipullorum]
MFNTTGRLLALNLAAVESRDDAQRLIQDHLDTYTRDEVVHIVAIALATLAGDILAPSVERMSEADQWREHHRSAARQIAAGPIQKED